MNLSFRYRVLRLQDEPFLWEMLYQAIHVPPGEKPPPREIIFQPELARYVQGWGRPGDSGWVAVEQSSSIPSGAAWLRLLTAEQPGYGYIDDQTPEVSVAVLPECRGHGAGTELLERLVRSVDGLYPALSLSVSDGNAAVRLYERMGFEVVSQAGGSLTMRLLLGVAK